MKQDQGVESAEAITETPLERQVEMEQIAVGEPKDRIGSEKAGVTA